MVRKLLLVAVILLCSGIARAQGTGNTVMIFSGSAFSGSCSGIMLGNDIVHGNLYFCAGPGYTWALAAGSGGAGANTALSNLASVAPNIAIGGIGSNTANACGTDKVCNILNFGAVSATVVMDGAMASSAATFTSAATSATPATVSGNTTFNNEVWVSVIGTSAVLTPPSTPTARYSVGYTAGGSGHEGLYMGDQTVATAGSVAANTGSASSAAWASCVVPLIPSSGNTISYVANAYATSNSGGATVLVPTGTVAGDLMVAAISWYGSTTFLAPSGWAFTAAVDSASQHIQCLTKVASASEPASYKFAPAGGGTTNYYLNAAILDYHNAQAVDSALTSSSANWSSANVGQDICVWGLATINVGSALNCGVISNVANSTTIYPSFSNATASSVSGLPIMFGPDSSASCLAATNALIAQNGGTYYVPVGNFFCTAGNMAFPYTLGVEFKGTASSNMIYGINSATFHAPSGSFLVILPSAANDAGVTFGSGTVTDSYPAHNHDEMHNVGIQMTGAGSGNCVNALNYFIDIHNSDILGCGGTAIYASEGGGATYSGVWTFHKNYIAFNNVYGVDLGSSAVTSNADISFNEMDHNLSGGIHLSGQQQVSAHNNQIQWGGTPILAAGVTNAADDFYGNWFDGNPGVNFNGAGGPCAHFHENIFEVANGLKFNGQAGCIVTGNDFQAGTILASGSTWSNPTVDATNYGGGMTQSFSGNAGTASCAENVIGGAVTISCYLSGYQRTSAAQTWTFPIAMVGTPLNSTAQTSCGTYNPSATATVLTLPQNASMTAETCQVILTGQTN